ncbi:hypothetical protein EJ08DRAFT_697952 [Tothia fuscella]|uniref:Increased loss of mitochondrial DNA protein 1 n=1 Tax=Tothia fuscella TaxID=1048955 RepID=A0A9P4NR43_9PEZI|nr:hypothetical protein EJ08DRAFT_697952 [Tothia fuscella]
MAVVSAFSVIRALSLFHITLAFYFLTNPRLIADQNLVIILGEAMQMPHTSEFNKPTPVTAFLAIILSFLGVSDLLSVSMVEHLAVEYWSSMTPIRLLFLFPLTAYTYMFKPDGFAPVNRAFYKPGPGDHLKNSLIFSWCFLETVMWFWVYVGLRDQRRSAAMKVLERKKADEGMI